MIFLGLVFFIIGQFVAYIEAGEQMAILDKQDIALAFDNKIPEDFDSVKVKVSYVNNGSAETSTGYGLNIPGNYIVVAQKNKTVAISKANITTVEFLSK